MQKVDVIIQMIYIQVPGLRQIISRSATDYNIFIQYIDPYHFMLDVY